MYRSLILAALAVAAESATLAPAAAAQLSAQDSTFVTKAAQAGMAEVKLAAFVLQRSRSTPVVSFATHMQADHSAANAQLASIAKVQGFSLPAGVGPKNAMLMTQLEALSGAAFDTRYLTSQLRAHRQVLAAFRQEAAQGQNPALVAFAKRTIPVIEKHIGMDKRDIAGLGGGAMSMRSMPAAQ